MGKGRTIKYQVGRWYKIKGIDYQVLSSKTIRIKGKQKYEFTFGNNKMFPKTFKRIWG